jgi:hypothetical protein
MTAATKTQAPVAGSADRCDAAAGRAASAAGRVPDFFVVGHAKSGTTALHRMLAHHPQLFMPEPKEPWFFCTDMAYRFAPRMGSTPASLAEYRALYAGAPKGSLVGEASSSYLWSRTAAAGIAEQRPDARIVAILREPASFLRSLHLQLVQTHVENRRDLRRALELEDARRRGKRIPRRSHRPQLLMYSDHVRYAEQLKRYEAAFGRERMLVLIYDDFRADNPGTVRRVLRFLGVDDSVSVEPVDANPTVLLRSQMLDTLLHEVSVGRGPAAAAVKRAIKAATPTALRRRALHGAQRHVLLGRVDPADEVLMAELRVRFKDEVVAVSEYLERDLVGLWGYDAVL